MGLLKLFSVFRRAKDEAKSGGEEKAHRLRFPHVRTIRARGMLVSTGLVLAAVAVAVCAFAVSVHTYYYSAMRTALTAKAETASQFFSGYISKTYAEYYQSAYRYAENFEDKDSLELQFVNPDGQVEISSSGLTGGYVPDSGDIREAIETGKISYWRGRRAATGERIMAVSAPLLYADGSVVGLMRYVTSLRLVSKTLVSQCLTAVLVGLIVLGIVTISNLYFLSTISQPIRSLTAMARRIAGGSYGTRLEKRYDDEIGELTDTINDMSQKLAQAEKLQTEFISSVSHELRTPLTAITGWAETMAYDESIRDDSRKGLEIITREAGRLTKMVEDLLEFTRMQDGRFNLQMESVNLPELVEDMLFTYSELFRQAGMTISYDPPEEDYPEIPGDPARLSQVLLNLLDNACKYGREGKRIEVAIRKSATAQAFSVRDHGPGIPPEELSLVKNKFYKGSTSKERGNGIGLAVCEEIVSRHNGKLTIYNADGGGLLVTVTLPCKA